MYLNVTTTESILYIEYTNTRSNPSHLAVGQVFVSAALARRRCAYSKPCRAMPNEGEVDGVYLLSVMPRRVFRSALGSLGSALAVARVSVVSMAVVLMVGWPRTSGGRWLELVWCVCLCPLGLCLLDQRLLVLPLSLLGLQLLARRYGELVVEAVEDAGGQGAPSEDLRSSHQYLWRQGRGRRKAPLAL